MTLPYRMLLTWLFEHDRVNHPYSFSNELYLVDHVMIPLSEKRVFRFKPEGKRPHLPTLTPSNSESSDSPSPTPHQGMENDPVNNYTLDPIPYMNQLLSIEEGESLEFKQTKGIFGYCTPVLLKNTGRFCSTTELAEPGVLVDFLIKEVLPTFTFEDQAHRFPWSKDLSSFIDLATGLKSSSIIHHPLLSNRLDNRFHDAAYKVHKGTEAAFSIYEKLLVKFRAQYGKDVEKLFGSPKVIQDAIKEDPALNKKDQQLLGENVHMETQETKVDKAGKEQEPERPTRAILMSTVRPLIRIHPELEMMSSPSTIKLTDTLLEIPIPNYGAEIELIGSLRLQPTDTTQNPPPEPQVTQREGKAIATEEQLEPLQRSLKIYQLTNDEIKDHLDKKERIMRNAEQAKLLAMTKIEIVKVVHEEAEKARIDTKIIESAKGGEQFKKIQDAELQVYKREHIEKVKRQMELRKKRLEGIDRRNFDVHNPFKFADFRVTKLDELGPIIEKKKNKIVTELMISLGKRYERLRKIPEELGIQSALPAPCL
ncbi:hypothetical protein Tco_0536152 [Tanacetum coccineum]